MDNLFLYLHKNSIIAKNTYIELFPFPLSMKNQYVSGIEEIVYTVDSNSIVVYKNNKKNFSDLLLTYLLYCSDETSVVGEKINCKNAIELYIFLSQMDYFSKNIYSENEIIDYAANSISYLIDPDHHDYYYLDKFVKFNKL